MNDATVNLRYWLWVVEPKNYDRKKLAPRRVGAKGDWWTCNKDTKKGDLILMWRTKISDIGYLLQANTDAYSLKNDSRARKRRWHWGCDWKVLYEFENPISIEDLRSRLEMQDWVALRANFRQRAYEIPLNEWQQLNRLLARKNENYASLIRVLDKQSSIELTDDVVDLVLEKLAEGSISQKIRAELRQIPRHHNKLSNAFLDWLTHNSYSVDGREDNRVDIRFSRNAVDYSAELKACIGLTTTNAIRQALGQLLEYNFYPGRMPSTRWVIILDQKPTNADIQYLKLLKSRFGLPMCLGWRMRKNFVFAKDLDL